MSAHHSVREGLPRPVGASWDGDGVNFALFSAHATGVELCLYDESGTEETARSIFPNSRTRFGTAISPESSPVRFMATACMDLTSPTGVIVLIPINCC